MSSRCARSRSDPLARKGYDRLRMLARHIRELIEKHIERIARLEIVEQRLDRHARAIENRRTRQKFG